MGWERKLSGAEMKARVTITPEEAAHRLKKLQPIYRGHSGQFFHIELPIDIHHTAYQWDPKKTDPIDANNLKFIGAIHTYHTCGYHGFFKPTIAEVLAQAPAQMYFPDNKEMVYFEVLFDDELIQIIDREGFYGHSSVAIFYKKLG